MLKTEKESDVFALVSNFSLKQRSHQFLFKRRNQIKTHFNSV